MIRAADTRMAGHMIAFLRLLRIKPAVNSTIMDSEFIRLPVALNRDEFAAVLTKEGLWHDPGQQHYWTASKFMYYYKKRGSSHYCIHALADFCADKENPEEEDWFP